MEIRTHKLSVCFKRWVCSPVRTRFSHMAASLTWQLQLQFSFAYAIKQYPLRTFSLQDRYYENLTKCFCFRNNNTCNYKGEMKEELLTNVMHCIPKCACRKEKFLSKNKWTNMACIVKTIGPGTVSHISYVLVIAAFFSLNHLL